LPPDLPPDYLGRGGFRLYEPNQCFAKVPIKPDEVGRERMWWYSVARSMRQFYDSTGRMRAADDASETDANGIAGTADAVINHISNSQVLL